MSSTVIIYIYLGLALLAASLLRKFFKKPLQDIRGPQASSWLLGHERQIRAQAQVGDLDFQWIQEYGAVWRTKTCWNEDVLMIADPRAIQHIFQTSAYRYPKRIDLVHLSRLVMGRGILAADGHDHPRHRKVMNPAFSTASLRSFLPIFRSHASKLSEKFRGQCHEGPVNVAHWLSRTTLDIVGSASFDYDFGALEDKENELVSAFKNLFVDCAMYPATWNLLFKALWYYIPTRILNLAEYIPTREYRRFRAFNCLTKGIANQLVQDKGSYAGKEEGVKTVMSLLIQANTSQDSKSRLDKDEVLSQMATLMFAGHDTTALALSWLLLELAYHPDSQKKIREEIKWVRCNKGAKEEDFSPADLDSMTFTNAAIKESMRLHPIISQLVRTAAENDIIPLAKSIVGESGNLITEIHIRKGQNITASVCGYNRLPNIWGEDAEEWNPTRFLVNKFNRKTSAGLWENLMSFSAGVRGCLGWRFAVMEMQAILVELIEKFEFQPVEGVDIMRVPAGAMIPMVRGKMQEGSQMPLYISAVA